jgi:ABC-type transport system substrate-binding protein
MRMLLQNSSNNLFAHLAWLFLTFALVSCSKPPDPNTLVMLIESSPTNLDPRVGVDAQSERIDNLIFDDLLSRGDNLDVAICVTASLFMMVDRSPLATSSGLSIPFFRARFAAPKPRSTALSITSMRPMTTPSSFA